MRRSSAFVGATILAIALYFVLFWGFDALRILTSPTYGLEDIWRSQTVFGIGRFAGLGPYGLIKLAAIVGALKLTVAGVCAVHVIDRLHSLVDGGSASNEILETGLLIAVAMIIIAAAPAVWSQNADLVRELTIQLLLAALAAVLCIFERSGRKEPATPGEAAPALAGEAASGESGVPFTPWRR